MTRTAAQVRQEFIDFFRQKHGHAFVPSSPVVPLDDPTLLFTNAGMNQFKPYFLGTETPKHRRVANTQKCIRAGGKHNDLDDVGHDTYHHTFFEMLGNWSFGDYFKKEAIAWAWELLVDVWGLDPARLHATYFQGDEAEGLAPDDEARALWLKILPPERVHPGNKKDNFWEMGETGPCGPCSEIHIDLTPDKSGAKLVNAGDARAIEIWNLVFIQFNRDAAGKLTPLPAKHVDTGMGFERVTAVLQGKQSNYDTDIFAPIFKAIRARERATEPSRDREGAVCEPSRDRDGAESGGDRADAAAIPAAYFITFHTYGTWLHGREDGSVDREHNVPDTPLLGVDEQREQGESASLTHEPVVLDAARRGVVADAIHEVAAHRGWSLHALNVRTNHVHLVVSAPTPPERVMNDFKSYATRRMVERGVLPAETKAWARHGSTRYLWREDDIPGACEYVAEGQGADLPVARLAQTPLPHGRGSDEGPLPYGRGSDQMREVAYRVIADHVRTLTFAITDGAVPDKESRGYVLRRILRRAVRFGWQYLNLHEPFLCDLVDTVVATMGDAFPELKKNPQHVKDIIREEEESFERTLDRGISLFEEAADFARTRHHNEIRGEDAFKLHDTYGFPIDLTQVMAQEKGLTVDIGEYERLMEEARERARACAKGFEAAGVAIPAELLAPFGPTDDSAKYTAERLTEPVRAIVRCGAEGRPELLGGGQHLRPGESAGLVFGRTCFYAEAGGQVGDKGTIGGGGVRFDVEGTQLAGDVVVHFGTAVQGEIAVGQSVELRVDVKRRATMKNHTATHVLNWALREVLGEHVQQKGSLVDHEKTRFDFSHPRALTPEQIERVEQLVNERIRAALPVHYRTVPQQDALKINGLRAVFGERYPDEVRVMSVGVPVEDLLKRPDNPEWRKHSIEFCGGTHLSNTAQIEHFVITHEDAVAKGIRRLVATTGDTARLIEEAGAALVQQAEQLLHGAASASERSADRAATVRERSSSPEDVSTALAELQNTLASAMIPSRHRVRLRELIGELQKLVKQQQKAEAADAAEVVKEKVEELLRAAEKIGATTVVVGELPDVPVEQLKMGADLVKQRCGSAAVLFGVRGGEKATLLAAMSPDLIKRGLKAGDLVKHVAPLVEGGGGGPPTMAQAGGKNPAKLGEALEAGRKWIAERL